MPYSMRLLVLALPFALSGCGFNDWANANMPVIGERCENWQCFTESGREQSKLNEQERVHPVGNPVSPPKSGETAFPTPAAGPATQPLAPPMPPEGAYQYVPRAPAAPGTSPMDIQ